MNFKICGEYLIRNFVDIIIIKGKAALEKVKSLSLENLVGKEIADQIPAVEMPEVIWFSNTKAAK